MRKFDRVRLRGNVRDEWIGWEQIRSPYPAPGMQAEQAEFVTMGSMSITVAVAVLVAGAATLELSAKRHHLLKISSSAYRDVNFASNYGGLCDRNNDL